MSAYFSLSETPEAKTFVETCNRLVPSAGNADSLHGELARAAMRIEYDLYNNGMCNNMSGAVNFLREYLDELPSSVEQHLDTVQAHCNTGNYVSAEDQKQVEAAVFGVVAHVAQVIECTPDELGNFNIYEHADPSRHPGDEDDDDGGWIDREEW